jgi:Flp pilus assembly protein TadB
MSPMTAAGFNVPHKKRLMELPREQQAYALEPGRSFMLGMATWLVVISWLIQLEMYYAAFNGHGTGYALPVVIFFTLLPVAGAWWLSRAVKRRIEALESAA